MRLHIRQSGFGKLQVDGRRYLRPQVNNKIKPSKPASFHLTSGLVFISTINGYKPKSFLCKEIRSAYQTAKYFSIAVWRSDWIILIVRNVASIDGTAEFLGRR